jgi:hypothetical protein
LGQAVLVAGAILVVAAAAVGGALAMRPTGTATTPDGVAVACIGVEAAGCEAWAASVLADGPGIHTFDPEDLERVRLSRSVLGLFGDCQAEYFGDRYDEAVARETVDCPEG